MTEYGAKRCTIHTPIRAADGCPDFTNKLTTPVTKTWGGKRPGSGRTKAGTKQFLIRMKPSTMRAIKRKITKELNTPGKVLDKDYDHTKQ